MSSSCSSENNGCVSCAPNLSIWTISTSTSEGKVGFTCLDGGFDGEYYKNSSSSGGKNAFVQSTVGPCYAPLTDNISYYAFSYYSYNVDNYGVIIIAVNSKVSITENLRVTGGCIKPATEQYYWYYLYESRARGSSCEQDTESVSSNYNFIGIPDTLYCNPSPSSPSCSLSVTCTNVTSSASSYSATTQGSSTGSQSIKDTINTPVDLSEIYSLCKTSVSTKMSLLETNEPQNCDGDRCQGGKKDDCWVGAGSFSIADNNLDDPNATSTTAQKLKFKIAAPKEGFSKKYKSISGRVIFYYGGTGGKTPCCDDDFDGTIVEENPYSISAASTFKDDYFAVDCGEFDNDNQSLVGETINICYTVDNIEFI